MLRNVLEQPKAGASARYDITDIIPLDRIASLLRQ